MNIGAIVTCVLFFPLIGGLLSFMLKKVGYALIGISVSFIVALLLFFQFEDRIWKIEWLPDYIIHVHIDSVSTLLICLVTFISLLVHVFSLEYMKEDQGKCRYFSKLGFFTFSMIGLLIADHLILLFVFWELVGLASYLLIGFWYQKEGVSSSARLAFMVNRVADVALLSGILILHTHGTLNISELDRVWFFLPSILIAFGAFGKSAQLPFAGWLTRAMVGPTPVSALIHAATMVAAGVYLLFRLAPYLHADALIIIAIAGTATAFYGGICALFQHDIKKILAYSTISQLGYMVMGVGVGGEGASMFHLFTHAFFKAGLFLGAGSIIHFLHASTKENAQDIRNMGGLKKNLPWTYLSFVICSLALAGIPFFSGFMSKDGILIAGLSWAEHYGSWAYLIPDIGLISALLTALYVGKMLLLVFWGENRFKQQTSLFMEATWVKWPLVLLALGSCWFFYAWNPFAHESWLSMLWSSDATHSSGFASSIAMFLSIILSVTGLVLAYAFFKPNSTYVKHIGTGQLRTYKTALNGFYLVEVYHWLGRGVAKCSTWIFTFDRKVIDGVIDGVGVGAVVSSKLVALVDRFVVDGSVNLSAHISSFIGKRLAGVSSRDAQTQFAWLLAGVILILIWILFF